MEYRALGCTELKVSVICLGTMTWGQQNTEAEAHEQMDYALAHGVNFMDTAELYAVPARRETQGLTEQYIGSWFAARKNRDQVVLATKVAGPAIFGSGWSSWIRGSNRRLDAPNIRQAVQDSLKRLKTDYIDLYQLHWPDRPTNYFGQRGYEHREDPNTIALADTLAALQEEVQAGRIRYVGVSNETPWGVMRMLGLAEQGHLPRIQSIQNPYSLLNRSFEVGLAEVAIRERCGLLAYSPLACGVLSGKYLDGSAGPNARLNLFGGYFDRYSSGPTQAATRRYVDLARQQNLSPSQMALAYVNSRPFVTSNIIGATSMAQLKENIGSMALRLDDTLLAEIEQVHQEIPDPAP